MLLSWISAASDPLHHPPSEAMQRIKRYLDFMSEWASELAGEMNQETSQE